MRWLVTGAAGYIGAHVVRAMLAVGEDLVALDDLSTGVADRLPVEAGLTVRGVADPDLADLLADLGVTGVVHLAAKKSVPESVADPLRYYAENVGGTTALLAAAVRARVGTVVYSSSAAVYGETGTEPVTEDHPTVPTNPYGETKLAAEWAVRRAAEAHGLRWCALRYFNVAGAADASLADRGVTNLLPLVHRAQETGEPLQVFGDDYDTPDGTCVRDYVHVDDLADAHVAAARSLAAGDSPGVLNVGRNAGVSVLEMVEAVERVTGRPVPRVVAPRRPGDPARVVADASRIGERLGWRARRGLDELVTIPAELSGRRA
jgi:UDP-glucose 4-epimerase